MMELVITGVILVVALLLWIILRKLSEAKVLGAIASIKKTSFREGDVIVLTCEQYLSDNQFTAISSQMKKNLPKGVKTILLEGGLRLSVLAKGEED